VKPRISVFKGREAKLNKAILLILAEESPLNISQVYKKVRTHKDLQHTRYRVVNRRMKALEKEGYIEQVRTMKTPQGFVAKLYQSTPRAYLAFVLNAINFDMLIQSAEQSDIVILLATFLNAIE